MGHPVDTGPLTTLPLGLLPSAVSQPSSHAWPETSGGRPQRSCIGLRLQSDVPELN